jgi:hypothetical protein
LLSNKVLISENRRGYVRKQEEHEMGSKKLVGLLTVQQDVLMFQCHLAGMSRIRLEKYM